MPVDVSYVMAAYKESLPILKTAVDSVLQQDYSGFELILILDNPNREDWSRLIATYEDKFENLIVHHNKVNLGLARSLNEGILRCSGRYILRADADDVCYCNRTKLQVEMLERNQHVDILGSAVDLIDGEGRIIGKRSPPLINSDPLQMLLFRTLAFHPTWAVRREVFEKLGGYRDLPCSQDYDFLFRAAEQGFVIDNIKNSTVAYRITPGRTSAKNTYEQYIVSRLIREQSKKRITTGYDCFNREVAWDLFLSPGEYNKTRYIKFEGEFKKVDRLRKERAWIMLFVQSIMLAARFPDFAWDLFIRWVKS